MSIAASVGNDRYGVLSSLGSGGMATVSVAFDHVRGHEVALKRFAVERFTNRDDRRRAIALFEREYFTLAELSHPRIVSVYDYGIDERGPYYTMEHLPGENLRTLAPLSVGKACSLLRDVASALAIVHSRRLVHRDVTHLNVRCTADGRAKLIDFGAMVPAGASKDLVGTPPFVAPECLELQTLDARTDLYSLGACLYYALTGRHAYPARQVRQLRELWRTPAIAPSRWASEIPESLDRLVLALLNLQPTGRPSSAAEVFERLTAIGRLEKHEDVEAARAYFTSPALVGRDAPLSTMRARLLSATRGRGTSVLVDGPAGSGRSRVLDAVALEARLLGLEVARADGADAQRGPFGVARRLLQVVLEAHPELAAELETRELSDLVAPGTAHPPESRERFIEGACELLWDAARSRGWAYIVDDLHLVDEPSFAVLASLATHARSKRMALVTSIESEAWSAAPSALVLLGESSRRVTLSALDEADSRALLASLTGDVPHLDTLSAVVFATCQGNPGRTIEAARSLAEARLLRYQGGTWLVESDPSAMTAVLARAEVGHSELLSPDADELVSLLALDRDRILRLADYVSLTEHRDPLRVHRALDELVRVGLITPIDDSHRLSREADRALVIRRLDDARRRALHSRIAARVPEIDAVPIYAVYHLLEAGELARATRPLLDFRALVDATPRTEILRRSVTLDTLEKIAGLSDEATIENGLGLEHGAAFVINAIYQGVPERGIVHARAALARLAFMTGLADYHSRPDLEPSTRLGMALGLAAERCQAPMALPGFDAVSAVRRLCQLSIVTTVCARFMADVSLLEALPDLTPFAVLSPAVGLTTRLVAALSKVVRGQDWLAWDAIKSVYDELRGPLGESLDPLTRLALEVAALGFLSAYEVEHATEAAVNYLDTYAPAMPNLAESLRARYYLSYGDLSASSAARRRFEVLSVHANGLFEARLTELPGYLNLYALSDDLLGLERTVDAIEKVVAARPGWRPRLLLGRAHLLRSRGESEPALRVVEGALGELGDRDPCWPALAALHLDLLRRSRRPLDAVLVGTHYVEHARQAHFPTALTMLALGEAHAECEEPELAEACFEDARAALAARGARGLPLGYCYEVGARIALRAGRREAFSERLKACANFYRRGHNPALTARYDALVREAADFDGPSRLITATGVDSSSEDATATIVDGGERHLELLRQLAANAGTRGGILYVNTAMGLVRRHATLGLGIPADLDEEVMRYFTNEVSAEPETSLVGEADERGRALDVAPASGIPVARFVPCLLDFHHRGTRRVSGVVVFALAEGDRLELWPEGISAIAAQIAALPSATCIEAAD